MSKQQYGDVEADLKSNTEVCQKIATDEVFAQHVYAALCNQRYFRSDVSHDEQEAWSCSWRYAAGLIAEIRNEHYHTPQNTGIEEDYIHWYCSGMGVLEGAAEEGAVTNDVRDMFTTMGWNIVAYPSDWGMS
jgi:hypothetical protein